MTENCSSKVILWIVKMFMKSTTRRKVLCSIFGIFCLSFSFLFNVDFIVQGNDEITENNERGFLYVLKQGSVIITGYEGVGGDLDIPWSLGGAEVVEISENAFRGNEDITSINLPNSIQRIGRAAFSGCTKLLKFRLSSQIEKIPEDLFNGCIKLTSILIPERVTEIGRNAFAGCINLIYIYFGGTEKLTHIGPAAFLDTPWFEKQKDEFVIVGNGVLIKYNGKDKKVKLPWNSYYIADAFENHSEIEEIVLAEWTKGILENAFRGCTALKSVQFGNWITEIGPHAFENCVSLENITLPVNIRTIGSYAFAGCQNLSGIESLDNLSTIEPGTFMNCRSLENIVLSDKLASIGENAFSNCISLKFVKYGEKVNRIGKDAFSGCTKLISIQMSESLAEIGEGAFQNSGIQAISLPIGIEKIQKNVFKGCNSLKEVRLNNINVVIDDTAFEQTDPVLIIPDNLDITEKERHLAGFDFQSFSPFDELRIPAVQFAQKNQLKYQFQPIQTNYYHFLRYSNTNSYAIIFSNLVDKTELIVPSRINGFPVSIIGEAAFQNFSALQSLVISDTITTIGNWAFSYCTGLKNIIIGKSVVSIGADAFHGDTMIEKIYIPPTVRQIGSDAFKDCPNLIITGESGSEAETYSFVNGIPFEIESLHIL